MKEILEPLKEYSKYQERFDELVDATYEHLVKTSHIDVKQNQETVKKFNDADGLFRAERKKLNVQKNLKSFLIFLSVAAGIAIIIGALMLYGAIKVGTSVLAGVLTLSIGAVVMVAAILIITLVINKKIKLLKESAKQLKENADSILQEAWKQMEPLNSLFSSDITHDLVNSLDTIIHIDNYYSVLHEVYLNKYFKFPYFSEDDSTTTNMIVGTIAKNPFVIAREVEMEMGTKVYEGSLVVTWTETRRDSKGNVQTVTHSQTLVATVSRPCPYYNDETFLVYANEAAPNLNFSRSPQAKNKDDKQIERMVKRGERKLSKLVQDDMKHGDGSFVAMSDTEFDILFGAFDRDNETQFRLLFTPLAQRNTIDLIKDSPYDDDFYFIKKGKINTVLAHHADNWQMLAGRDFASYSVDISRELFANYNKDFFKHLYFMLAPLLNIPLYQQLLPNDMSFDLSSETNIAAREAELMANILPAEFLANADSATRAIYKIKYKPSIGAVDNIMIFASSFGITPRVEYVPRIAGNGRMYSVPVYWDEYFPLECTTEALLFDANGLNNEKYSELVRLLKENDVANGGKSAIAECSGIMIVLPKEGVANELANKINTILKTKDLKAQKEKRILFMAAIHELIKNQHLFD